jgi:hypothetical protein
MKSQKVKAPPPPTGLSSMSEDAWRLLVPSRARSPGRRLLVEQMLRALDRTEECRALIAAQGLTQSTKTTGMVHVNPLVKAEREARGLFAKLAGLLSLEWDAMVDGRGVHDYDADSEAED